MSDRAAARLLEAWDFQCDTCGEGFAQHEGFPYRCPLCGGTYELSSPLIYQPKEMPGLSGIERYRASFPISSSAPFVSLGEGQTPLLSIMIHGREVYLKNEGANPTGSFKDRGSAVLMTAIQEIGSDQFVEDSSGNAGASFAAYAARAGLPARVFVPSYASGPKRAQIEAYGATVVPVEGPRSAASDAVVHETEKGAFYASHAHWPHVIAGMASIAFEIFEEIGEAPEAVVLPVGQGSLLLGCQAGFEALANAGKIDRIPKLIGVQAMACAPLWSMEREGRGAGAEVVEGDTLAEGIRIARPHRSKKILEAVEASGGTFYAVDEADILSGHRELALRGLFAEPTSSVIWPVLEDLVQNIEGKVVGIITGSGYKAPNVFGMESA